LASPVIAKINMVASPPPRRSGPDNGETIELEIGIDAGENGERNECEEEPESSAPQGREGFESGAGHDRRADHENSVVLLLGVVLMQILETRDEIEERMQRRVAIASVMETT